MVYTHEIPCTMYMYMYMCIQCTCSIYIKYWCMTWYMYQVRHLLDGRVYAIKKIHLTDDPRMKERITREVELLSQMNHENVVRCGSYNCTSLSPAVLCPSLTSSHSYIFSPLSPPSLFLFLTFSLSPSLLPFLFSLPPSTVRYYNAWMETYSEEDLKSTSGVHLEEEEEEEEEDLSSDNISVRVCTCTCTCTHSHVHVCYSST